MALSPSDLADAQSRLAEAKAALHQLRIGGGIRTVRDASGDMVSYSPASISNLTAYIKEIEAEIADCVSTGPIRPRFY